MCSICGETSHLTRDCPERHNKKKVEESRKRDQAYLEFMNELDGGGIPTEKEEPKDLPSPPVMPSVMSPMASSPIPIPESDDMQLDDPTSNYTAPGTMIPPAPVMVPTPSPVPPLPTGSLQSMAMLSTPTPLPIQTNTPSQVPPVPIIRPGSISYASPPSLTWQQQQALLSNMRMYAE